MKKVPTVLQTAETDCAPACLTALLRYTGRTSAQQPTLTQLREVMDPGRDGISALVLKETALAEGLELKALLLEPTVLAEQLDEVGLPAVLHLSRQHYVVVEKVHGQNIYVMDPAVGRRRLHRQDIAEQASGLIMPLVGTATPSSINRPESNELAGKQQQNQPSLLRDLLGGVRGNLVQATVLSAVLAVGGLGLPVATALIVDALVVQASEPVRWLVLGLVLAVLLGGLTLARYWVLTHLQYRMAAALSTRVARALFSRRLRFFERRSVGDLFGRVESSHAVHALLSGTLLGAGLDAVLAVGYLIAFAVLSPLLALMTGAIMVVVLVVSSAVAYRAMRLRREEILVTAQASTTLMDGIEGIRTLRSLDAEAATLQQWDEQLGQRLVLTKRRSRLNAIALSSSTLLSVAAPLLTLVLAGGQQGYSPGMALGLMALTTATLVPVTSLAGQLVEAAELRPLLERIQDVEAAEQEPTAGHMLEQPQGSFSLKGLGFKHVKHGPNVLQDITAEVPAGSKVVILGPTGCGKSTLALLLAGLHEPTSGQLLLDGQPLQEIDRSQLRAMIGVVLQEPWMPQGSIYEAVLAGRKGFSEQHVWAALQKAHVSQEISALPMGLHTQLGSGGQGLSGGQRQRLALARALLPEPKVLILDEPTSALDTATEALIEQTLSQQNMTRIVITHRLGSAAAADQVWEMAGGKIIQQRENTSKQVSKIPSQYDALAVPGVQKF